MLKKLLKYDLKALFGWYAIAFGVCLLVSVIARIAIVTNKSAILSGGETNLEVFSALFSSMFTFLAIGALLLVIFAVAILTTFLPAWQFYKSYLKDEGYLMYTLPVTTKQLYNSKMISALLGSYAGDVVILASIVIAFTAIPGFDMIGAFFEEMFGIILAETTATQNGLLIATVVFYVLATLIAPVLSFSVFYASFMLGQLATKNHFIWSIISYFAIQTGSQTIAQIGQMLLSLFIIDMSTSVDGLLTGQLITAISTFVATALFAVGAIITARVIMKKHLNLA